jgi:hypothetical protein
LVFIEGSGIRAVKILALFLSISVGLGFSANAQAAFERGDSLERFATAGLDLEYDVIIDAPMTHKITVKAAIKNIELDEINVEKRVFPDDLKPPVKILKIRDKEGNALSYLKTYEYDRVILKINVPYAVSQIIMDYEVDLGDPSPSDGYSVFYYLGDDFGIVPAEMLFLQIIPDSVSINSLKVVFDLPVGWDAISRLENTGDFYTSDVSSEVRGRLYDGFYIAGPIALGDFEKYENVFGETNAIYAIKGYDNIVKSAVKESFFKLFQYYHAILGAVPPLNVEPPYKYMHVSVPKANGLQVWNQGHAHGEYRNIQVEDLIDFYSDLAHVTVHEWIPLFFNFPWPSEPFTEYYAYRGLSNTGVLTADQAEDWLVKRYIWYYDQTTPQERNTISVRDADDNKFSQRIRHSILYRKGALLFYVLNSEVEKYTGGKSNIDDVMRLLWDKVLKGHDTGHHEDDGPLIEAINSITGHDFREFFEVFFYKPTALPMRIDEGRVKIVESELPRLNPLNPTAMPCIPLLLLGD